MRRLKNLFRGRGVDASLRRQSLRALSLCAVAVVLIVLSWLAYRAHTERLRYERSLLRLSQELQSDRLSQKELERSLAEARSELNRYRTETEAAFARLEEERRHLRERLESSARILERKDQRVREIQSRLAIATQKIRELERERWGGEAVIKRFTGGVAYVEVAYTFEDRKGRRIRFEKVDSRGEPVTDAAGETSVSVEAGGPVVHIRSSGTGFLIAANRILTNRHVIEPWAQNQAARPFLAGGYRPVRTVFRAFFPGIEAPFALRMPRAAPEADLAVAEFDAGAHGLPVLQLDGSPQAARVGRAVLLIGYPAGVESLLARVDPVVLKKIREIRGNKVVSITNDLSQRGLIRPLVTWGHLSEVRRHQITYDALTTAGGSGSPILNAEGKVIGVNQAMLQSFAGSSFGIPAQIALEFIRESGALQR